MHTEEVLHSKQNLTMHGSSITRVFFVFCSTGRRQQIWLQKSTFMFLFLCSLSFSFLLTPLSFRGIVLSGFHILLTCLSRCTLQQHCYDWHSTLANPSPALFPIVIPRRRRAAMFSLALSELPWQRAGKVWRSLKASSVKRALLASADDCTVSFIFMKENTRQDWTGGGVRQPR